ncbi:hypothetical protein, partial [Vibrio parahaemolyticus]|uniref:hypothetical protein n=1 Tax=Vibrio parahaemolyticus TaxID=670 RepID=UPI001A9F1701
HQIIVTSFQPRLIRNPVLITIAGCFAVPFPYYLIGVAIFCYQRFEITLAKVTFRIDIHFNLS